METTMYIVWPIIILIAVVIELNTLALAGWAVAISSSAALITHAITRGKPIWIEIFIFLIFLISLWTAFLIYTKKLKVKIHDSDDGYLNYLEKVYQASKGNNEGYGEIKINDKYFRFRSKDSISPGDLVKVKKIRGVTFTVQKESR